MTRFRQNVVANALGRLWMLLLSIALLPIYLRLLGLEAYGLVGFFITTQFLVSIIDFGVTPAVGREMARCTVASGADARARSVLRTFEVLVWWSAPLICLGMLAIGVPTGQRLLHPQALTSTTIGRSIALMSFALAFQWPTALYASVLSGLQRQLVLSAANAVVATFRFVGSAAVLLYVSRTVEAFFIWQVVVSVIQAGVFATLAWHYVPAGSPPRFDKRLIQELWRFASSIGLAAALVLALGQVDKLFVSARLPMAELGLYTIATTLAGAIQIPPAPIGDALMPVYAQLVATGARAELVRRYHRGCQLIACAAFPAAAIIFWFAAALLRLWTRTPASLAAAPTVQLLVVAGAVNVLMTMLDHLQTAAGSMRAAVLVRLGFAPVLVGLLWLLVPRFGIVGAGAAWLLTYVAHVAVAPAIVFPHLMPSEGRNWLLKDASVPLFASFLLAWPWRLAMPIFSSNWGALAYIGSAGLVTALLVALILPEPRKLLTLTVTALAGELRTS